LIASQYQRESVQHEALYSANEDAPQPDGVKLAA